MSSGRPDHDGSYVSTDEAGEKHRKTKTILCTLRYIWRDWGELAYKRRAKGERANFRERKKTRVSCSA